MELVAKSPVVSDYLKTEIEKHHLSQAAATAAAAPTAEEFANRGEVRLEHRSVCRAAVAACHFRLANRVG